MCPTGIIVLFACKFCSASLQSVPEFIEHKRLNHFEEFQKTTAILFKETLIKPYDQALHPKEDRLPPTLESKSTPNSEPALTITNQHETHGDVNKPEDCKPNVYPCIDIDIDCHSDCEAEGNLRIISVTSTSEKHVDNLSSFACEEKILHPPKLKQIGPKADSTCHCSQIQTAISSYNKNKNDKDNENSGLCVQPELGARSEPFHNPYVLIRRLTTKQIQKYSFKVKTDTKTQQVQGQDLPSSHENSDDFHPVIFLRPKVEILEECGDLPLADYTCKFCQSHFVSYTALQLHLKTCVSFVPTSHSYCSLCNSYFSSSHDLQAHNLVQHGTQMDKNSGQFLQNRKRSRFSIRVQPYKCSVCGTWFVSKASLNNHRITHTHSEEEQFVCCYPRCGKRYKTVHTLDSHRANHSNGFSCKFRNCGSIFESQSSLKDHVWTHINK